MTRRWSILSVTDLHYEQPDSNYVDDPKELEWPAYRDNIFSNFDAILKAIPAGVCDLVALGGDITTHGRLAGIQRFDRDAMARLIEIAGKPEAVCVVPGNHDVTWGLEPTTPGAFATKFAAISDLVRKHGVTSCLMPDGALTTAAGDQLKFVNPANGPLYIDRTRKLLVACVNSAIRCGEINARIRREIGDTAAEAMQAMVAAGTTVGREPLERLTRALEPYMIRDVAHVTAAQQRLISDALANAQQELGDEWGSYLRVALLHHHVLQFPNQIIEHRGYEALVDGGRVLSMFADYDFDLILTGHKHQPYEVVHRTPNGQELLVVGGPTVGGHSAGDSFRGLRWIDLEENGDHLLISIADVRYQDGEGNVRAHLERLRTNARPIPYARRPGTAFEQRARRAGFSYREVSSISILEPDGDARRAVEYEDLEVTDRLSARASSHPISLSTSGYLANLSAWGRDFTLHVDAGIPRDRRPQSWSSMLAFDQKIGLGQPASYAYRWFAVNAFALDTDQFDFLHGREPRRLDNVEFTYVVTREPVRELTVVVSFPPGFVLPSPPRLRIAVFKEDEPDARMWEIDTATEDALASAHALRFYEELNVAALRVSLPLPHLTYGIQWEVPAPPFPADDDGVVRAFWDQWSKKGAVERLRPGLHEILREMFGAVRRGFLGDWPGPIDGSLMWFDRSSDRPLAILAGATESKVRRAGRGASTFGAKALSYQGSLAYGDGIAGRAFKANRFRIYVAGDRRAESDEPDYYTQLAGGPLHEVLVSIPVHVPEPDELFRSNARIYERRRPYAVLSVGSTSADCPLKSLRFPERIMDVLTFQHLMNTVAYQQLKRLVRRPRSR